MLYFSYFTDMKEFYNCFNGNFSAESEEGKGPIQTLKGKNDCDD